MNADETVVWLLFLSCVIFLIAAAVLILAGAFALEARRRLKELKRQRPQVQRDGNGRRIQERI